MRALLAVGVDQYEDSAIADLAFARSDAAAFAAIGIEQFGVEPELAVVLNGEINASGKLHRPSRSRILQALSELVALSSQRPLETFYFFFSGHGLHDRSSGREYLLTTDTAATVVEDTALSFEHLERFLRKLNCIHRVLFIDACRSRVNPSKSLQPEDRLDVRRLCPEGMVTFCSCHPGTASYEAIELGHGVFTYTLMQAFGKTAICASVDDLDAYLEEQMPLTGQKAGLPEQRPYTQVEPLSLRKLVLVSDGYLRERRRSITLGRELRTGVVATFSQPLAVPTDVIAGVDFGTSYSAIAVCLTDGQRVLVPSPEGGTIIPSIVRIDTKRDYTIGWAARNGRGGFLIEHPKRALVDDRPLDLGGAVLDPVVASSLVLRSLRRNAEEFLQRPVVKAVIGMPADFSVAVRRRVYTAFELAGYHVIRDVTEPSAVALATFDDKDFVFNSISGVLAFDLGGGTFDAATVTLDPEESGASSGVVDMTVGTGDHRLGGVDFDLALAEILQARLLEAAQHRKILLGQLDGFELRRRAEDVKRLLGTMSAVTVVWSDLPDEDGNLQELVVSLSRDECTQAVEGLLSRLAALIRNAVDADFPPRSVVLGGQGGKMYWVRDILERELPGIPVIDRYQESAVVLGLARQAGILAGTIRDTLLLELTYWGMGLYFYEVPDPDNKKRIKVHQQFDHNSEQYVLLKPSYTIPTLRSAELIIQWHGHSIFTLSLFSISPRREWSKTGDIHIGRSWVGDTDVICLELDIDVDRVAHLHVHAGKAHRLRPPDRFDPQKTATFLVDVWRRSYRDAEDLSPIEIDLPPGHPQSQDLVLVGGFDRRWRRLKPRSHELN